MDMEKSFMKEAISIAKHSAESLEGGPFGAVITKDGKVVARANNTVTTSKDPSAHAEINAIRLACQKLDTHDLSGCEIYASCEPCPMCLSAIYWARIDKIYYAADRFDAKDIGFDDSLIYEELALDEKDRSIITKRFMAEEGLEPFEIWKKLEDKVEY